LRKKKDLDIMILKNESRREVEEKKRTKMRDERENILKNIQLNAR
jgi:hypothetical protein